MLASRRLLLSCKNGANQASNFLRRSGGPSKRIQSFNYSKSTRQSHGTPHVNRPLPIGGGGGGTQASSRSRVRYAIPALVLGFTGFISFLHYNDERRAVPKGQASINSGCGCGSNTTAKGPVIGGPFTLVTTQNKIVTQNDFCGKWVLLYFGYSFSPDVGPEQLKMMSKAVDKLESKHNQKIMPVFVTLDPQRDTPSHLHAYLKEFDSRILGLTGPASAMRQMAQEYCVYFKKVQEDGDDYLQCFQCGERGHYARDCDTRKMQLVGKAAANEQQKIGVKADFTYDEDMWMVYKTTSDHMTPYDKFFTSLDRTLRAQVELATFVIL